MKIKVSYVTKCVAIAVSLMSVSSFADNEKIPLKEISKIAEVFSIIDQRYVEDVDKSKLMLSGLSGMVKSLDPYSTYLSKGDVEIFNHEISGKNVGIGVIVVKHESGIKIETVLKNSPSEKAGLESGDVIIKVNDVYLIDKYTDPLDGIKDIKGDIGSEVNLTIQKNLDKSIVDLIVKRDEFIVPSTNVELLNNEFGYAYISSFQENTSKDLLESFKVFNKNNHNVKGFIIDLRSNPGGLLSSAISISDMFLNQGKIVSTKSRFESDQEDEFATKGDILNGKPIVVLINSGTASAAEIVSGALQDNKRAIIVGQTSYGKGSVQTLYPLSGDDGDMVKLTIARYYTPSGRSIQAEGITPDIKIERVSKIEVDSHKKNREKDNKNHILNDTSYKADVKTEDKGMNVDILNDYQLFEALNVLKAITVLKH